MLANKIETYQKISGLQVAHDLQPNFIWKFHFSFWVKLDFLFGNSIFGRYSLLLFFDGGFWSKTLVNSCILANNLDLWFSWFPWDTSLTKSLTASMARSRSFWQSSSKLGAFWSDSMVLCWLNNLCLRTEISKFSCFISWKVKKHALY